MNVLTHFHVMMEIAHMGMADPVVAMVSENAMMDQMRTSVL